MAETRHEDANVTLVTSSELLEEAEIFLANVSTILEVGSGFSFNVTYLHLEMYNLF